MATKIGDIVKQQEEYRKTLSASPHYLRYGALFQKDICTCAQASNPPWINAGSEIGAVTHAASPKNDAYTWPGNSYHSY